MATLLEMRGISKRFGGVHALRNVDLSLETGEVHCLIGENGSGKSTLIKIMAGVEKPEPGGRIFLHGRETHQLDPIQSTANGIQVIYQDLSLFPNLTVAENIAVSRHLGRLRLANWNEIRRSATDAMDRVGINIDPARKVAELSIANRQLVAICRAMASEAKLVIMDEPTASLTRREVKALIRLVADLKRKGISVMFVSHRLEEVMEIAEEVTVLRDGVNLGTFSADQMNERRLGTLMTGREFNYPVPQPRSASAKTVLSVRHLSRPGHYEDVSFDLREGEIVGLTGLLGSGRTELALSLFGMNPPDSGEAWICGKRMSLRSNQAAIADGIAYVPEDRLTFGLALARSISSNILATVLDKFSGGMVYLSPSKLANEARHWITQLTIKTPNPNNPVGTLSGGNQQRVVLAKWMATKPRVLILDSPTVGVDINAKHGIYEVIRNLAAAGVAVLMISDEVSEVFFHTHRVLAMKQGRIIRDLLSHATSEAELSEVVNA